MSLTLRSPYVAGPVLLGAYGVIRLLDGLDGVRGPGLAWTAGHLCFIAGVVMLGTGLVRMRRLAGRTMPAGLGLGLGLFGCGALVVQFAADVVAGWISADHDAMEHAVGRFQDLPGVVPVFYSVGPLLFFVGQLVLVMLLARRRLLRPWAPLLVLADSVLPFLDKDLIPVGAVLLLLSYAPLRPPADAVPPPPPAGEPA